MFSAEDGGRVYLFTARTAFYKDIRVCVMTEGSYFKRLLSGIGTMIPTLTQLYVGEGFFPPE